MNLQIYNETWYSENLQKSSSRRFRVKEQEFIL